MKLLGRRLFSKATMGVPFALPTVASPAMLREVDGFMGGSVLPSDTPTLANTIWRAIGSGMASTQQVANQRYTQRQLMGGLDPDLAVLNSMSVVRRVQLQVDREQVLLDREKSLRHKIIKSLGGNPEDFE